jgi:uncharacterized protein
MHSRRRWLVLLVLLWLAGCETVPGPAPGTAPSTGPATPEAAEQAEGTGEYVVAARQYEELARAAQPPQKQEHLLNAADALIKGGWLKAAADILGRTSVAGLEPALVGRKRVLEARLALADGSPARALLVLDQAARLRDVPPGLRAELHEARAQAELGLTRPFGAVQQLILREPYLTGDAVVENQMQLWRILDSLSREQLTAELPLARDAVMAGWIELALTARENAQNAAALTRAVSDWRARYDKHPAGRPLLESLTSNAPTLTGRIERIALLLPLTSDHALAAQAVRDGFLALYAKTPEVNRPKVTIYDLGGNPALAPQVYERAVQDGAQIIVGPLGRDATNIIVRDSSLAVPTLLLNHTDEQPNGQARLFQFGLLPEQEAREAAERAYLEGCRQAALLYPASAWGERMMNAFSAHWQRLGGVVLANHPFLEGESDYSEPVKRLLNISGSETRKALVERQIGQKLQADARARQDVECLFLAANARAARLIKPQLNYFNARRVPVYATSHIYTGKPDPAQDADLDDIQFGDMPWMLLDKGRVAELRKLQGDWPYAHSDLDRLYAFGMDAYAILPHLNRISAENAARFNGVTSGLSLDSDGRLRRQLAWAKFRNGVPRPLDQR